MPRLLLFLALLLTLLGCTTSPASQSAPAPYQALIPLWSVPIPEKSHTGPYTAFKNNLYITFQDANREIRKVRLTDGQTLWSHDFGHAQRIAQPVSNGSIVVYGQMTPQFLVTALDDATGQRRWVFAAGGPIYAPPCFAGDTVFITSSDGNLYALRTSDGHLLWKAPCGKSSSWAPLIYESNVIASNGYSQLMAFDVKTGQPAWSLDFNSLGIAYPILHNHNLYLQFLLRPSPDPIARLARIDLKTRIIYTIPCPFDRMDYLTLQDNTLYHHSQFRLTAINPDLIQTVYVPTSSNSSAASPSSLPFSNQAQGGGTFVPPSTTLWEYAQTTSNPRPLFTSDQILFPISGPDETPRPRLTVLDKQSGTLLLQSQTGGLAAKKNSYKPFQIRETVILDDSHTISAFKLNPAPKTSFLAPDQQHLLTPASFEVDDSTAPWSQSVDSVLARAIVKPDARAGRGTRLRPILFFKTTSQGSRLIPWATAWMVFRVVDEQGNTLPPVPIINDTGPPIFREDFTLLPSSQTAINITAFAHGIDNATPFFLPCTEKLCWIIPPSPNKTHYLIISLGAPRASQNPAQTRIPWYGRLDLPPIPIPIN